MKQEKHTIKEWETIKDKEDLERRTGTAKITREEFEYYHGKKLVVNALGVFMLGIACLALAFANTSGYSLSVYVFCLVLIAIDVIMGFVCLFYEPKPKS